MKSFNVTIQVKAHQQFFFLWFLTELIFYVVSLQVPAILNEAVPATTQNVQTEIQNTTKLAFRYTGECLLFFIPFAYE